MISRHALGRALALCDAAKLRLPTLEESLARGLASFHAGVANVARSDLDAHSVAFNGLSCTTLIHRASLDGVTLLTQRRHSSSEEAFREYGRNFSEESTPFGVADSPDDGYGETSYPEGLPEEEHMDDEEEQHESNVEREMRQQLLKAALPHVVRTKPSLMAIPRHMLQSRPCHGKGMTVHNLTHGVAFTEGERLVCGCIASRRERPGLLQISLRHGAKRCSWPGRGDTILPPEPMQYL